MFVYVPWRAPKPAAKVRSDAQAAGDSKRHKFGEVEKRGSICSIKECSNRNARMGCKTCNVHRACRTTVWGTGTKQNACRASSTWVCYLNIVSCTACTGAAMASAGIRKQLLASQSGAHLQYA